jgi:hypothetical protein
MEVRSEIAGGGKQASRQTVKPKHGEKRDAGGRPALRLVRATTSADDWPCAGDGCVGPYPERRSGPWIWTLLVDRTPVWELVAWSRLP